ncbi:cuticle protein [Holotrichia oblita]|uniref:Cuticle protein n=1 Tax=Holotrichia oblita TaxID=644536 RepID=A0ACB9SHX2_HOLOL|nr:cuticle protein [Holotrichia oblita]
MLRFQHSRYAFESDVEDHINDLTMKRFEERDGLNVRGAYEYSDGYLKRTVHYIADENGFRIVKEESEPLPGPKIDLNGVASVTNKAHGTELTYSVKSVPVKETYIVE